MIEKNEKELLDTNEKHKMFVLGILYKMFEICNIRIKNPIKITEEKKFENTVMKDLEFIDILNILVNYDKSFISSQFVIEPPANNKITKEKENIIDNNSNIPELTLIEKIYTNLQNKNNIKFLLTFDKIKNKILKNIKNNLYLYLYDFLLIYIIFSEGKSLLSSLDKIILMENKNDELKILNLITNNISLNTNILQQKSLFLYNKTLTRINILEQKIKKNNEEESETKPSSQNKSINSFESPKKTSKKLEDYPKILNKNLSSEDYLKIINKKDYIINQLQKKLNTSDTLYEENDYQTIISGLEEQVEYYCKENDELKRMYDQEFELVASALYNIGIEYFAEKEKKRLENLKNEKSCGLIYDTVKDYYDV